MITNLIIVNAAFYVANLIFTGRSNALIEWMEIRSGDLLSPINYYRLLSYAFAHDPNTIWHLLFNMMSLYFLGQAVEMKYGRGEFIRFYLTAAVLGGIVHALLCFRPGSGPPVVGASGAVIAVNMLFVFNFPQAQLLMMGVIPVRAWVVGVITVVTNTFFIQKGVAVDVHLAGIAFASIYFFGGWDLSFMKFGGGNWSALFKRRPKLKVHRPEQPERLSRDDQEADRILEKIHREGTEKLTAAEKQFMESYSRKVREKRKSD
ncbi:MAG: rhomboid family intramembrane serine protease [Pirellulales bacterium]